MLKIPNLDSSLKNYRSILNLNYVGKLIEKAVSVQVAEHMDRNKIGEIFQSAYKPKHSCETALLRIFHDMLTRLDKDQGVLVALLDLSAAFDTVDHTILLKRLKVTHV